VGRGNFGKTPGEDTLEVVEKIELVDSKNAEIGGQLFGSLLVVRFKSVDFQFYFESGRFESADLQRFVEILGKSPSFASKHLLL
jgi:hypothetical protein